MLRLTNLIEATRKEILEIEKLLEEFKDEELIILTNYNTIFNKYQQTKINLDNSNKNKRYLNNA